MASPFLLCPEALRYDPREGVSCDISSVMYFDLVLRLSGQVGHIVDVADAVLSVISDDHVGYAAGRAVDVHFVEGFYGESQIHGVPEAQ